MDFVRIKQALNRLKSQFFKRIAGSAFDWILLKGLASTVAKVVPVFIEFMTLADEKSSRYQDKMSV